MSVSPEKRTRSKRKASKPIIIDSSEGESEVDMGNCSSRKKKPVEKSVEVPKKRVKKEESRELKVKSDHLPSSPLEKSLEVPKKSVKKEESHELKIKSYPLPEGESSSNVKPQMREKSSDDKENRKTNQNKRSSIEGTRRPWNIFELLSETEHIDCNTSRNIVDLFDNENTIPFICRYRRDLIGHITPERLRDIKTTYTEIVSLRKKAETIITTIEKESAVVPREVKYEIMCAKTKEELEFIYAPYKAASKGSLADRAKALGLEQPAEDLLLGSSPPVDFRRLVNKSNEDLNNVDKVKTGICNILIYKLSKNTDVLEELRRLINVHQITLSCSKSSSQKKGTIEGTSKNQNNESKYEMYYTFQNSVKHIRPHQSLAINRGEKLKYLSVKVNISDSLKWDMKKYIRELFMRDGEQYKLRSEIFEEVFEECFSKKLQPLLTRQVRSDLNDLAEKASINVFAKNLRELLLTSPLKGERILGIDPGFTNGCKMALISETADVLDTGVIYPHTKKGNRQHYAEVLCDILFKHHCHIIAIGNGTACRETEFWLSSLFEEGTLDSNFIKYSIVSEQGASIYSCSEVAKKEFPNMDLNLISAVSIARRLNDPLSEYVKIEPKHIGVGMYQHDVNEKMLTESLNEVISECVSFVGVDINTASLSVLKHLSGLSEKKAEKIIQHRNDKGLFKTRDDLLKVKSIGEKTFVQCAGFIRIEPKSLGSDLKNKLDCTWVHPESYSIAKKIISKNKLDLNDIGSISFIRTISTFSQSKSEVETLVKEFKAPIERIKAVLEGLQREPFKDYRDDFQKEPLFKQGITKLSDLVIGTLVSGAVTNITHFGAFVDIGVETNGLIHTSKMNGTTLRIGDRVSATVTSIDIPKKRVGLSLE
ncbi:SRBD1 family protein [Megaselia abdita]